MDYEVNDASFTSFRVNTPDFGIVVMEMAWVMGKVTPNVEPLQLFHILTGACLELEKPVLTLEILESIQAGGENDFIETAISANFMVDKNYNFGDWNFIFTEPVYKFYCGSMSTDTKRFLYKSCVNDDLGHVVASFCGVSAGFIQRILIVFDSCSNESCSELENGSLRLTFLIKADMADPGGERTLECYAMTKLFMSIRSSHKEIFVRAGIYEEYEFIMSPGDIVDEIKCEASETVYEPHKKVSGFFKFPDYSPIFKFYSPLNGSSLDVNNDINLYLENYIYGTTVNLYAEMHLYPTTDFRNPFSLYFEQFMEMEMELHFTKVSNRLICGRNSIRKNYFIEVKVETNYSISGFGVSDTGKYRYRPNIEWPEVGNSVFAIDLIHPISVECDDSCKKPFIGSPLTVQCALSGHVITANAMQAAELPLKIRLNKQNSSFEVYDSDFLPCEANIALNTTLEKNDIYKVTAVEKKVIIKIEFSSIQPWIEGSYFFSVEMSKPENCPLIGKSKNDCVWLGSEENPNGCIGNPNSKNNHFYIELDKDFGTAIPTPSVESCGTIHPEAFYFLFNTTSDDSEVQRADDYNNFYRFCRITSDKVAKVEAACSDDGGSVMTDHDFVKFMEQPKGAFDLKKAWKTMICRANNRWLQLSFTGDSANEKYFHFLALDARSGEVKSYHYDRYGHTFISIDEVPAGKNMFAFCKYQRGKVWKIEKLNEDCKYLPLTSGSPFNETLSLETHGDLSVDVECFIRNKNKTEGLVQVSVPYKEDASNKVYSREFQYPSSSDTIMANKVSSFQCRQKSDNLDAEAETFTFEFSSSYMQLKVAHRIRPIKMWTAPEDSSLRQPCYGDTAIFSSCVEGNH